jgi:hypothetical protein
MNRALAVPLSDLIPSWYAVVLGLAGLALATLRGLRDGSLLAPAPAAASRPAAAPAS